MTAELGWSRSSNGTSRSAGSWTNRWAKNDVPVKRASNTRSPSTWMVSGNG